jgi:hypothetical protein
VLIGGPGGQRGPPADEHKDHTQAGDLSRPLIHENLSFSTVPSFGPFAAGLRASGGAYARITERCANRVPGKETASENIKSGAVGRGMAEEWSPCRKT